MGDLSINFSRHEFACKGKKCCGGSAPVAEDLVTALQRLRNLIEMPIHVNSGFRCLTHNRRVGSKDTSQHPLGLAADIAVPKGMALDELIDFILQVPEFRVGGIGKYPRKRPEDSWVHVDVRKTGPDVWLG